MARKSYQKGSVALHNGCWTVRYRERDHTGVWKWRRDKLEGCKDKKDALLKASRVLDAVNNQDNKTKSGENQARKHKRAAMTFRDCVELYWKAYAKKEGLRASTMHSYNTIINKHLMPEFGDWRLVEIETSHITEFFAGLTGLSANTERAIYQLLNLIFELALLNGAIQSKPTRSKLHRRKSENSEKPSLSPTQVKSILEIVDEKHRLFILLIATSGLRIGEAVCLRWFNFDSAQQAISVTNTYWRGHIQPPKTKASKRTLHLPKTLVALIDAHRMKSQFTEPDDFIFCKSDGKPVDQYGLMHGVLYPAMDKAGIKREKYMHGWHILRHSAGSVIYARTNDLKLVQKTLGHAKVSTTSDIYIHMEKEALDIATELMAKELLENCDLSVTQNSQMVS